MIETRRQRQRALLWALACAALFTTLSILVIEKAAFPADLDTAIGPWPLRYTFTHPLAHSVWVAISTMTGPIWMPVLTVVVVVALLVKNHRRAAVWTAVAMSSAGLLERVFKFLIGRHRPLSPEPESFFGGYSFPSGHTTAIATAAGVAIVLARMLIRRRGLRRLTYAIAIGCALVVGTDRIFLGAHYFSDVIAGYLLGAVIILVLLVVFDPQPRSIAVGAEPLLDTIAPSIRSVAAILNPTKIDDPEAFRALVEKLAAESGWARVTWWLTTPEDTGYQMAHEAAVSGADLVIAIGGDGTVRAVCEELAGTGVPVGIVPAGTGNLLARNLSIPLYLRAAVDVALNGQDRAIDMVQVTGDDMEPATYLVMAGMGLDAAIMQGVNEGFKKWVGWLAYVWSGLKSMMFPAIRVEVSVDGGPFTRHRARTIVIGNVGNLQAGVPLIPDAAIDDGQLDLVLLYPRRFLSWLPIAARVWTKNKRTDETITRMTGRSVVVRTATPTPRQLDGDLIAPGRELHATCVHGRLLVRVPR